MQDTMSKNTFKVLSFFGAGISLFLSFVNGSSAGYLINAGEVFNGVGCILSGMCWVAAAYLIYRNFEKKDLADKPGVKFEDLKNKK